VRLRMISGWTADSSILVLFCAYTVGWWTTGALTRDGCLDASHYAYRNSSGAVCPTRIHYLPHTPTSPVGAHSARAPPVPRATDTGTVLQNRLGKHLAHLRHEQTDFRRSCGYSRRHSGHFFMPTRPRNHRLATRMPLNLYALSHSLATR